MSTFQNTLNDPGVTVAELAISHPAALSVFTRYNIDYCCGGNRSLEEACIRLGLNPEKIREEVFSSPANQSAIVPICPWMISAHFQKHYSCYWGNWRGIFCAASSC